MFIMKIFFVSLTPIFCLIFFFFIKLVLTVLKIFRKTKEKHRFLFSFERDRSMAKSRDLGSFPPDFFFNHETHSFLPLIWIDWFVFCRSSSVSRAWIWIFGRRRGNHVAGLPCCSQYLPFIRPRLRANPQRPDHSAGLWPASQTGNREAPS